MRDRGKQELKAMNVKGESEVESVVQINGTGKSNLSDTN
jgi:chromosome segregation ATPase